MKSWLTGSRQSPRVGADFEHILELCRYTVSSSHGQNSCRRFHFENLRARGETDQRLHELDRWHDSLAFTLRAKAALQLSEAFSFHSSDAIVEEALKEVRQHFAIPEIIRLTLAITAVNDWIDTHRESPVRILVVEDSPDDQELLWRQLQKIQMDQNVVFISDGREAFELLDGPEAQTVRQELIAIFLDLHLPGMSGVEFLRRLRGIPDMETFPVIVMTSTPNPADLEECRRLKIAGYVEKPVTSHSFSKAVADLFHSAEVLTMSACSRE